MSDGTKIEWTDATWNPIRARTISADGAVKTGWHCVHASEGCRFCYAETFNRRLGTGFEYKPGHLNRDVAIFLDEKMLLQPLIWKRGRKIFVCSMTDLFADFVPDEMIDRVFAVMALCPQHTFQVLTKRPDRMRDYLSDVSSALPYQSTLQRIALAAEQLNGDGLIVAGLRKLWPLPNVWLGTSVEDRPNLLKRVGYLRQTPAARRFLSCEPLLGNLGEVMLDGIDWVIVGGESGKSSRPMHPDWARSLRDQCAAADVAFFFKQWGEWWHECQILDGPFPESAFDKTESVKPGRLHIWPDEFPSLRIGKKAAGRLLDGVQHDGMPG